MDNSDFSFNGPAFLRYLDEKASTDNSFDSMKGYLGLLYNQFFKPEGLTYIFDNINDIFSDKDKDDIIKYLRELSDFVYFVIEHPTIKTYNSKNAKFKQYNSSGLKHYISFLEENAPQLKKAKMTWKKQWGNAFNTSRKKYIFDGSDSLFQYSTMGCSLVSVNTTDRSKHENNLIKHAIRSSFFFDFNSCKIQNRHDDIRNIYLGNTSAVTNRSLVKDGIPFRDSSRKKTQGFYPVPGISHQIYLLPDHNGNVEVCKLIKKLTGYSLFPQSADFVDFTISHIWRNAPDARFFTNLWNIVIVPTWVNFFLDNEREPGSLSSKMLDTFKKVCIKQYRMQRLDWKYPIPFCPISKSYSNAVADAEGYEFNVINGKNGISSYGRIKVGRVTIP